MRNLLRTRYALALTFFLPFTLPARAQSDSATDASTRTLIESILDKAGLSGTLKLLTHGVADGSQTLVGSNHEPIQAHLEMSSSVTVISLDTGSEKRTITYSPFSGSVSSSVHAAHKTSLRIALSSKLLYFPLIELLAADHDSQYSVSATGQEELNGRLALTLSIASSWLSNTSDSPMPMVKLYIDPVSFQVLQRDDTIYDANNTAYARSVQYSDYRSAGSLVVPFKMTEFMSKQELATTQWNSISLSF